MLKNLSRRSADALLASGARALFAILALTAFHLDSGRRGGASIRLAAHS